MSTQSKAPRRRLPRVGEVWQCGAWGEARVTRVASRRVHPRVELTVTRATQSNGNRTERGDRLALSLEAFLNGTYTRCATT
jgi:hypothetical protein